MKILEASAHKGQTETDVRPLALFKSIEDPILRLHVMLGELPLPSATSAEIHTALLALARYDGGATRELSGLAAWLDFLRNPYAEDEPLGDWDRPTEIDQELSSTIGAAVKWVVAHPEYEDPLDALESLSVTEYPEARGDQGHVAPHREAAMKPVEKPRLQVVTMPANTPGLAFRPDAAPPFDAYQHLSEDREFKKTWAHKRTDLPDQSTEAYDREIAGFAVRAGWTDQQVVDLVIYHRTQQVETLKFGGSYYTDLLGQAKSTSAPGGAATAHASNRPELLEVLNRALKIEIRKIVKYGGNGGTFELQLSDGHKVNIGDAASVLYQRNVRAAIYDATGTVVPAMKAGIWDKVAEKIAACAGPAPVEESPETMEIRWLVRARLSGVTTLDIDERDRAGLAKTIRENAQGSGRQWAFRNQDGNLMLQLGGLLSAIRLNHGILLSFKEGGKRLRKLGWKPKDLDGLDDNGRACFNVWVAPRNWEAEG